MTGLSSRKARRGRPNTDWRSRMTAGRTATTDRRVWYNCGTRQTARREEQMVLEDILDEETAVGEMNQTYWFRRLMIVWLPIMLAGLGLVGVRSAGMGVPAGAVLGLRGIGTGRV